MEKPQKKNGKVLAKAATIVATVIGFAVGYYVVQSLVGASNLNKLASDGAAQAKASYTLPYQVDGVTTLTDITADNNTIQYHYMLHDIDTSSVTDSALRNLVQPKVCSTSSTRDLLDKGIAMEYIYIVSQTGQEFSFSVKDTDCQ